MPLLLLVIFGYAANFYVDERRRPPWWGRRPTQVAAGLPPVLRRDRGRAADGRAEAEQLLPDNEVDVAFVTGRSPLRGADRRLEPVRRPVHRRGARPRPATRSTTEVLYNPELKTSWVMIPAIIGLILTFIGTIITAIGLVRERETGTLEQLAVMPIRPSQVILGKITPYFLLAVARHADRHDARHPAVRRAVQRQPAGVRAGRGAVPVRRCSGSGCSSRRSRRPPGRPSRRRSW